MRRTGGFVLAAAAALTGCISTYQSARLTEPGAVSAGIAITNGRHSDETGESDSNLELLARYGASAAVELGFRAILIEDATNFTVEPKFPLVADKLAFAIPVGLAYGEGEFDIYQVHPTLIWSSLASANAELTAAGKVILMYSDDGDGSEASFGGNLGVRLSTNLAQWAIHPEVGVYHDTEGEGVIISFGVAFLGTFGGPHGLGQ